MRALFVTGDDSSPLEWRDVDAPTIERSTDALVAPIAVAACDLDRIIVDSRSPFSGSFMLGHEFTATVTDVGEDVRTLSPGDAVLASFQPSCGMCDRCRRGSSSACREMPNGCMYGVGEAGGGWPGAISERIRVPWADYDLRVIPREIDPASIASAGDQLADGLRCVEGPLSRRPGARVLIVGSGSVSLYGLLCARFLGAEAVTFASGDDWALQIAETLGADCLAVDAWPKSFRNHEITVDCTNDVDGLAAVMRSTAPYGESTSASIFFGEPVPVPMFHMNMKGITFHTGRVNSAAQLDSVLALVSAGLDPEAVQPAYHPMASAIEAMRTEPLSRKVILRAQ